MPFDQAFAISSVILAATAFSGLVLAQGVPFWLALPTAMILIVSLFHAGGVLFLRRALAYITDAPTLECSVDRRVCHFADRPYSRVERTPSGRHPLFDGTAEYQATHPSTAA